MERGPRGPAHDECETREGSNGWHSETSRSRAYRSVSSLRPSTTTSVSSGLHRSRRDQDTLSCSGSNLGRGRVVLSEER